MLEQRAHITRILKDCAEAGVPDTVDIWPEVRERVAGGNSAPHRTLFLPATRRAHWAVAMLTAFFLLGSIAYASGLLDTLFREYWPGGEEGAALGVQLDQEKTVGDRTIVLERAYADTENVVIGYSGAIPDGPWGFSLWDEDGNRFVSTTGHFVQGFEDSSLGIVSFGPLETMQETRSKRFVLELDEDATSDANETFVFEFEIPIRPVPEIKVGQEITQSGLALTLERVEVSPARTRFFISHSDPDLRNNTEWMMRAEAGRKGEEPLTDTVEGLVGGPEWQTVPVQPPMAEDIPPGVDVPPPEPDARPLRPDPNTRCAILDSSGSGMPTLVDGPGEYYVRVNEVSVSPDEEDVVQGPWEFTFEVPEQ